MLYLPGYIYEYWYNSMLSMHRTSVPATAVMARLLFFTRPNSHVGRRSATKLSRLPSQPHTRTKHDNKNYLWYRGGTSVIRVLCTNTFFRNHHPPSALESRGSTPPRPAMKNLWYVRAHLVSTAQEHRLSSHAALTRAARRLSCKYPLLLLLLSPALVGIVGHVV